MFSLLNCFPWTWEQCKNFCRWGKSHATPHENGTAEQNITHEDRGELEPLLEAERVQNTGNSDNSKEDSPVVSPTEQDEDGPTEPLQREPSISVIGPSRNNTLDAAALRELETPAPTQADNTELLISTGYSTKLDIPSALSKITAPTEETNVSPSSIHSSGSKRLANRLASLVEDGALLGVGQTFTHDGAHSDDSGEHTDDEILPQSQKLEEQLVDQLIEWPRGGNSYFIPIDQQKRLVTPMSIMEELRRVEDRENQHSKEELDDTTAKISNTARKMFSILVCLGKGKCIYNFLKEGLTDDHLPFSRFVAQATSNGTGVRTKLCSHRSPGKPIKSMANWSWNETTGFARDQWWMLAPVFKESLNDPRKVRHYNLDDNCVMPFIEDHERTDTIASGFSTVWAVRVHPAHQSLHSPDKKNPNPLIALKKLNSIDENDFRLEVEMLKAFSNHKDRHLIKLLATYRIKNRYHLMFPHCKYNLRTYWEANPKPKFTYTNVRWFLAQCKGIAHGLMTIHEYKSSEAGKAARLAEIGRSRLGNNLGVNPIPVKEEERIYGRHGDIKPENILWSDESESGDDCASSQELEQIGILVIADFGLMDFHGKQSRSMVQADVPASPTYAPPELRLRKSISRAYDIWSLGCLYLEFVTWLVCWLDELDKFPHARALTSSSEINDDLYYTIIEEKDCAPRAIVKESVTEWIQDLHEKPRCSQFIHDFVDLIGEMLVVDQNQRIHCGPLNSRLHEMCMKAKNDHGYLTDLIPRRPRAGDSTATEGSPTSPTASQGDLLRTKSQIPADLDTTTKSPKTRAAIPSSSRPVSYVRLRSPSPAGLRSSSPAPSIFLTEVDQKENTPSQRLGDDT